MFRIAIAVLTLCLLAVGCSMQNDPDCEGQPTAVIEVFDSNGDLVK